MAFCCRGCEQVYAILHRHSLDDTYYALQDCPIPPVSAPISQHPEDLKLDVMQARYVVFTGDVTIVRFYISGIQCGACAWLLEQLHLLDPQIIRSSLDFGHSILTVQLIPSARLSDLSGLIRRLGYPPTALEPQQDLSALWKKERRTILSQIGLAAFISGNIMIFSVSIYAGATGPERMVFEWLSALLTLPIVLWIALPFYKRAFAGLFVKEINIDLSVSIAILGGFSLSLWNLFHHSSQLYFDSISTFSFLLLSTRFLLKSIHHNLGRTSQTAAFGLPQSATVMGQPPRYTPLSDIPIGSIIQVEKDSIIPIDGELVSDEAYVDTHLLTGESLPQKHLQNDAVFALTTAITGPTLIKTTCLVQDNRMTRLLAQLETIAKPKLSQIADRVAKWFVVGVLLLAGSIGGYLWLHHQNAMPSILGLIMVSCPCALALTTPLIYTLGIQKAAKLGIFIKNPGVFDEIHRCKSFFFDKTGTLTYGQFTVLDIVPQDSRPVSTWFPVLFSLEHASRHPIAKAILRFLSSQSFSEINLEEIQEIHGKGVTGTLQEKMYFLGQLRGAPPPALDQIGTTIGLYENDQLVLIITLGDQLKPDAIRVIQALKKHHITPILLSGDHPESVALVAKILEISEVISLASPEEKYDQLSKSPHAVMIGDGVNDALALATASIGIAVGGSLGESLKTSSVYLADHRLSRLLDLIAISQKVRHTIFWTLAVSTLYNLVGVGLVLGGVLSPLAAAILMPTSSLTVTLLALWGLRYKEIRL